MTLVGQEELLPPSSLNDLIRTSKSLQSIIPPQIKKIIKNRTCIYLFLSIKVFLFKHVKMWPCLVLDFLFERGHVKLLGAIKGELSWPWLVEHSNTCWGTWLDAHLFEPLRPSPPTHMYLPRWKNSQLYYNMCMYVL